MISHQLVSISAGCAIARSRSVKLQKAVFNKVNHVIELSSMEVEKLSELSA